MCVRAHVRMRVIPHSPSNVLSSFKTPPPPLPHTDTHLELLHSPLALPCAPPPPLPPPLPLLPNCSGPERLRQGTSLSLGSACLKSARACGTTAAAAPMRGGGAQLPSNCLASAAAKAMELLGSGTCVPVLGGAWRQSEALCCCWCCWWVDVEGLTRHESLLPLLLVALACEESMDAGGDSNSWMRSAMLLAGCVGCAGASARCTGNVRAQGVDSVCMRRSWALRWDAGRIGVCVCVLCGIFC